MSIQCSIQGAYAKVGRCPSYFKRKAVLILSVLAFLLIIAAPAGAFETTRAAVMNYNSGNGAKTSYQKNSPSLDAADTCLSLLNTVRQVTPVSAMDPSRRPAGHKAATVGFVLGLRIALGPTKVTGSDRMSVGPQILDTRDHRSAHALAIADYRACKNQQALHALNKKTTNWSQ